MCFTASANTRDMDGALPKGTRGMTDESADATIVKSEVTCALGSAAARKL